MEEVRQLKTIDVLSMGRVGVDLYAEQLNVPLSQVSSFKKYLGGSPGNISVGCRRLGLESALFSAVGADDMGTYLLDTLKQEDVNIESVSRKENHLTALAFLGISPPSDFPLLFYRQDCADMQLAACDINTALIEKCRVLQFSGTGISTESMRKVTAASIEIARSTQAKIIFDLDYRPVLWGQCSPLDSKNRFVANSNVTQYYQQFLGLCDVIVGTDEELMIAGGSENIETAIKNIRALSNAAIVYKKGLEGSEVHILEPESKVIHADTFPVKVLNTLGAGDAFMSGLLYGLLKESDNWLQALSYGNACGAIVSSRHGCAPAMPTLAELEYFINQYPSKGGAVIEHLNHTNQINTPLITAPETGFNYGYNSIVSLEDGYQTGMNFGSVKLHKGETYFINAPLETAALLLYGNVTFDYQQQKKKVYRRSYFDEAPYVLHGPQNMQIAIVAHSEAELLIMQTPNSCEFQPLLFDSENMLENEHRGMGLLDDVSYRMVRTVFDKRNRVESNLVVGEIITFQGRWSSCPPHHHPQPEIYHYRFSEPQGFAFAENGKEALKVHHNETLVIQDQKTHAHATAPGYALYTLWFIRHLQDNPYIVPDFEPEHDWCRYPTANKRVWKG